MGLIPVDALVMHGIFYLVLILILVFVVVTYVHIISALISVDALVMHGIFYLVLVFILVFVIVTCAHHLCLSLSTPLLCMASYQSSLLPRLTVIAAPKFRVTRAHIHDLLLLFPQPLCSISYIPVIFYSF